MLDPMQCSTIKLFRLVRSTVLCSYIIVIIIITSHSYLGSFVGSMVHLIFIEAAVLIG